MDLDAATLWFSTRSPDTLRDFCRLGIEPKLLVNKAARESWKFVLDYHKEHGKVPGALTVTENTGFPFGPPVDDNVTPKYVAQKLFERAEGRALEYGLGKAYEALEEGQQASSVAEVFALADHLRKKKALQLQVKTLGEVAPAVLKRYEDIKAGVMGIRFPWDIMNGMTMGLWPKTLTCFVARPGVGKCVHEDTEIIDPQTGVPRAAWQVHKSHEHVAVTSWSKEDGVHARPIMAKVDTGRKECLRFRTRSGRSIVVTPEHPFLTPEGWRRADELGKGASVASPARMPFPQNPREMDRAELDMLAILLAEGSYSGNHVGFSTADPAILAIAGEAAEELGVNLVYRNGYDYDFVRRCTERHPVRELLRRLGADRKVAKEKTIPDDVFRLPREQLARFLTIFWMCDGTASKRGDASITLASEVMVRQIQSLLLRFGVQSRVAHRPIKDGFDAWRLRVYSHCVDTLSSHLSLWGQKADRLQALAERNPNVGSPRLSEAGIEKIKALSKTGSGRWRGGLHEKVAEKLGRSGFGTRDLFGSGGSVKMTAFRAFATVYGVEDEYRWWWESDIFWDEVESTEVVGEQKIYDLTVAPTSCFVANDLVVHNTWTAVNIAMHARYVENKRVLIVSPEIDAVEMGERLVSMKGQFAYGSMVEGTLGFMVEKHLKALVTDLESGQEGDDIWILDDEDKISPEFIEQAVAAVEPDIVIIDSIYMLRVSEGKIKKGAGSKGGRYDRILETIDWMRSFARRSGLPIVCISQLSREGKVKKGAIEAVKAGRGTGGLEDALAMSDTLLWDVHNLFAIWQDVDMRMDKQLMFIPLKVRRAAKISGLVIKWDMEAMDFSEIGTKVISSSKPGGGDFKDDGYDEEVPY